MAKSQLKKVLIVDDEEDLTWSISKNLSRDKDKFEIICVNSGKEALNVLSQVEVDLVVSDIRMPEITGLELLLEIKEKYSKVKVIIMTAYGSPDYEKEAFDKGCIYYLEKPFEMNHLREVILDSLSEKKGFVGQVSDFDLTDIIQMNCLGRITTVLYIEKDDTSGAIYFRDGNIVHAEATGIRGEEAFYEILSWDGGRFTSKRGLETSEETIYKGWQSLLLEGMKRADEGANFSKGDIKDSEVFKTELKNLSHLAGVKHVFVLDNQFEIQIKASEKADLKEDDIERVISSITTAKSSLNSISSLFQVGHFEVLTFKYSKSYIHLSKIPSSLFYILIIADQNLSIGKFTIQLKKSVKKLEQNV